MPLVEEARLESEFGESHQGIVKTSRRAFNPTVLVCDDVNVLDLTPIGIPAPSRPEARAADYAADDLRVRNRGNLR